MIHFRFRSPWPPPIPVAVDIIAIDVAVNVSTTVVAIVTFVVGPTTPLAVDASNSIIRVAAATTIISRAKKIARDAAEE